MALTSGTSEDTVPSEGRLAERATQPGEAVAFAGP